MRSIITKVALAASAAFAIQISAHATALGSVTGTTTFQAVTQAGSFADVYTFTVALGAAGVTDQADIASTSISFKDYGASVTSLNVYAGTYLTYASLGGVTPISTETLTSTTNPGLGTVTTLADSASLINGSTYTIAVAGTSLGVAGYTGIVALIPPAVMAPVPEPETYAMLLAGLGMVGFITRRRQKSR